MNWLKRLSLPVLTVSLTILFPNLAQAQITSGGDGTLVNSNGNTLNITGGTQAGSNLFHSFGQFNVNTGQTANFVDPGVQNILGRVTGGNASLINGILQVSGGNANLYLMNPAGIIFGSGASLNVAGSFTATTANGIGFGNQWFNAIGSNDYTKLIGTPTSFAFTMSQPGAIVNAGNLAVNPGHNITLLGGTVINTGTLTAPGGKITVAAIPGQKLVNISQDGSLLSLALPVQTGTAVNALPFTPLSLPQLLTGGNATSATGITVENGVVKLTGSGVVVPTEVGTTIVSNAVNVSGATGGTVHVLGNKVGLVSANINASGTNGGGTVLIGGDYKGQGIVPNAQQTYLSRDSVINVDAVQTGNGGRAIVWADNTTHFYGNISARGGQQAGNGGFVEVSGKETLFFDGSVNVRAFSGQDGQLLLDPRSVYICEGLDCPSAGGATINADTELNDSKILASDSIPAATFLVTPTALAAALNAGNVRIEAREDIRIKSDVNSTSNNALTLTAPFIEILAPITLGGSLNLISADQPSFFGTNSADKVKVSANLETKGGNIVLSAASNSLTATPKIELTRDSFGTRNIQSGGGNIEFKAPVSANGNWEVISSGGNITFNAATSINGNLQANSLGSSAPTESPGDIRFNSTIASSGTTPANLQLAAKGDVVVKGEIGSSTNPMGNFLIAKRHPFGYLENAAQRVELTSYTGNSITALASERITLNGSGDLFLNGRFAAGTLVDIKTTGNLSLSSPDNSRFASAKTANLSGQNITLEGVNISSGQIADINAQETITLKDRTTSSGQVIRTTIDSPLVDLEAQNRIVLRNSDIGQGFSSSTQTIDLKSTAGSIEIQGSHLNSRGDLKIQAQTNLDIQSSELRAKQDIALQAGNRLEVRDDTAPTTIDVDRNLTLRGNLVTIQSFNHPRSALTAGGDLTIQGNTLTANGRFLSNGNLSFLDLAGNPGSFSFTPVPSNAIISSAGDVTFGTYTGPSLKIEARGSIRGGDITITAPNTALQGSDPETVVLSTQQAVILRAGLGEVQSSPAIQPRQSSGLRNEPNLPPNRIVNGTLFSATDAPSGSATIQVGSINTTAQPGLITLSAPGIIRTGAINQSRVNGGSTSTSVTINSVTTNSVTIDAGGAIIVATNSPDRNLVPAPISTNGAPLTLTTPGDILTGNISTILQNNSGSLGLEDASVKLSGANIQTGTIDARSGGVINIRASRSFRALGSGISSESFPGDTNNPDLIRFLVGRGFSEEELKQAEVKLARDSNLGNYTLAARSNGSTDVPVIDIQIGDAKQVIANQIISNFNGSGRVVILGDSQQPFILGPVPRNGQVFVPFSSADQLEKYDPVTNNFPFQWNASDPLIYPSNLFPLNSSGIAGAIVLDNGTDSFMVNSLQYRVFVPPSKSSNEGANPSDSLPRDRFVNNAGGADRLATLRQRFQGQDGQITQQQLNAQDSSCVPSSEVASAAGGASGGGDRSGRAVSSTAGNNPCNPGAGSTTDDGQILKLLDGGVK